MRSSSILIVFGPYAFQFDFILHVQRFQTRTPTHVTKYFMAILTDNHYV